MVGCGSGKKKPHAHLGIAGIEENMVKTTASQARFLSPGSLVCQICASQAVDSARMKEQRAKADKGRGAVQDGRCEKRSSAMI